MTLLSVIVATVVQAQDAAIAPFTLQAQDSGYCIGTDVSKDATLVQCNSLTYSTRLYQGATDQEWTIRSAQDETYCLDYPQGGMRPIVWAKCTSARFPVWVSNTTVVGNQMYVVFKNKASVGCLSYNGLVNSQSQSWIDITFSTCDKGAVWHLVPEKVALQNATDDLFSTTMPQMAPIPPPASIDLVPVNLNNGTCYGIHAGSVGQNDVTYYWGYDPVDPGVIIYYPDFRILDLPRVMFETIAPKDEITMLYKALTLESDNWMFQLDTRCLCTSANGDLIMSACNQLDAHQLFQIQCEGFSQDSNIKACKFFQNQKCVNDLRLTSDTEQCDAMFVEKIRSDCWQASAPPP
ncbi:hypothetical protein EDD86DRAFT_216423 [Gorgonomyces haynaldii]|nr:hypothetical protein EDD86DRAFT_216423 [Gorgonomyces haynaldii]